MCNKESIRIALVGAVHVFRRDRTLRGSLGVKINFVVVVAFVCAVVSFCKLVRLYFCFACNGLCALIKGNSTCIKVYIIITVIMVRAGVATGRDST